MKNLNEQLEVSKALPAEPSDSLEILSSFFQRKNGIRSRLETNKEYILAILKKVGATSVTVSYSGSGDSGQIDEVLVFSGDQKINSNEKVSILVASSCWSEAKGWNEQFNLEEISLEAALEQFVYDWSESEHCGWENNDGASGECLINVSDGDFSLTHTSYYTESDPRLARCH